MNEYQKRILEARKEFLKLNKKQEKELMQIYIDMARELSKEIKSSTTNAGERYLKELYKLVKTYIGELNANLGEVIKDNIDTSSQIASSIETSYYDLITDNSKLKISFNKSVAYTSGDTVKKLIQGNYYADGKTLDQRIWNITKSNAKDIDRLIKINIVRGANSKKLAEQLERYINPTKKLDPKTLAVGMDKSISYQAQRLARTSITHSFGETTIENAKKNPFSQGVRWNLSSSHYERQVKRWGPDVCDEYAGRVYKPNEVPIQHPNCLCYLTNENISIEDAVKELKAWAKGSKNERLDEWYKSIA